MCDVESTAVSSEANMARFVSRRSLLGQDKVKLSFSLICWHMDEKILYSSIPVSE
jgi:hypothetical protein